MKYDCDRNEIYFVFYMLTKNLISVVNLTITYVCIMKCIIFNDHLADW